MTLNNNTPVHLPEWIEDDILMSDEEEAELLIEDADEETEEEAEEDAEENDDEEEEEGEESDEAEEDTEDDILVP